MDIIKVNKKEDKTTISKKFKEDILQFFKMNRYNINTNRILEVACYKGYTSRVFSFIFDEVIGVDNRKDILEIAKNVNKDRKNIKFIYANAYDNHGWNFKKADVFFIDCGHTYKSVLSDIDNCIKNNPDGYIIFDDYGLIPDVKRAVDYCINNDKLKCIKKLGELPGKRFENTHYKLLKDYEGIICKINVS